MSTKKTKTLEPQGFLPAAVLASYLVIQNPAAQTITAAHSQTPTRCMGHSSRYQRLNGSRGSIGFGCLYTVFSLAAVLLLLTWPALLDSNQWPTA